MGTQYWSEESVRYHRECSTDSDERALLLAKGSAGAPNDPEDLADWLRARATLGFEIYRESDLGTIAAKFSDLHAQLAERDKTIAELRDENALRKAQAIDTVHRSSEWVKPLLEALVFYADRENYRKGFGLDQKTPLDIDDGKRARAVLEQKGTDDGNG